jgi:hypothetical protein
MGWLPSRFMKKKHHPAPTSIENGGGGSRNKIGCSQAFGGRTPPTAGRPGRITTVLSFPGTARSVDADDQGMVGIGNWLTAPTSHLTNPNTRDDPKNIFQDTIMKPTHVLRR